MKTKIVALILVGSIFMPNFSYAATPAPTQNEVILKLISALLEQIKSLQAQLETMKQEATKTKTATTTESQSSNIPTDNVGSLSLCPVKGLKNGECRTANNTICTFENYRKSCGV